MDQKRKCDSTIVIEDESEDSLDFFLEDLPGAFKEFLHEGRRGSEQDGIREGSTTT